MEPAIRQVGRKNGRSRQPGPLRVPLRVVSLLVALTLFTLPGATAQVPCLDCDFEISIVSWSGGAEPGALANGTLRITNTGGTQDSYTIAVAADNDTWEASVEPETVENVPPGSGILAADDNSATFDVGVVVPDGSRANSNVTLTVTVQSTRDEALEKPQNLEATTRQVYAWALDCTPTLEVMKTKEGAVELAAENRGNGMDRAKMAYTPVEGVVVEAVSDLDAGPGQIATQRIEVGVGLRAEDGNHTIRWDLRSAGDPDVMTDCATTFSISGGTPGNETRDGDDEEGPAPSAVPILAALLLAGHLAARRRR